MGELELKLRQMSSTGEGKNNKVPESPRLALPMDLVPKSWTFSNPHLSESFSHFQNPFLKQQQHTSPSSIYAGDLDERKKQLVSGNSFSFASSTTSQLVLERIMSQSEVSPMTSGRPSCSELPNGNGSQGFSPSSLNAEMFDSPNSDPISPTIDFGFEKFLSASSTPYAPLPPIRVGPRSGGITPSVGGGASASNKTMGRWFKDRREKKKEEVRVQNAQLHAAISVAAVAAAVAATTAATAAATGRAGKDEQVEQTDTVMAAAATLVAARCMEAAEAMGAEREHLASVISSAVNVQSHGDIMTLTAAAATALRGAATLKVRAKKEASNIVAVLPHVERQSGYRAGMKGENGHSRNGSSNSGVSLQVGNKLGLNDDELLARGSELLKRTRKGELHWKLVSVYIDKTDQVVLKMKSKLAAGTLTKKKLKVLMEVCTNMPVWPERRCLEIGGEERYYFGLKTVTNRVIEFECKNQQEHDVWTHSVSRLLSIGNRRKKNAKYSRNEKSWD